MEIKYEELRRIAASSMGRLVFAGSDLASSEESREIPRRLSC